MLGDINPALVVVQDLSPAVYAGRDNVTTSRFLQYDDARRRDVPLDFSAVTRMVLVLPEVGIAFDSAVSASALVWSAGDGVVEFDLSSYAVAPGTYQAQLLAFDAEHPRGQVVVSGYQTDRDFTLTFHEVWSTGDLPPPLPSGGNSATRAAGETLSALRAVYERAGRVYALNALDPTAPASLFLGITVTAAAAGAPVVVQRDGTLDDPSFDWAEGPVYVGLGGRLTQVYPETGWELVVGASPEPTRLNVDFDEPVLLAQD